MRPETPASVLMPGIKRQWGGETGGGGREEEMINYVEQNREK